MEDALEVCDRPHDPKRPGVDLDVPSKELIAETAHAAARGADGMAQKPSAPLESASPRFGNPPSKRAGPLALHMISLLGAPSAAGEFFQGGATGA